MKVLRFLFVLVIAFAAIVLVINLPKLGVGMLKTITGITVGDWAKYIIGAVIGAIAMWFAKRERRSSGGE